MIESFLGRVAGGEDLAQEEMADVVGQIMQGGWSDEQIALLLTGLRAKGETVEEIAGAAAALRQHMTPVATSRTELLDTCGTGGDGSNTFNISTASALVAASTGIAVAKHGNRGMSSLSGSANVLAELGVNIEAPLSVVEQCLDELGICFCFAPLMHPSMKNVAAVRKKLGVPTIFNLLGPLANPAGAPYQLLGVGRTEMRATLAQALARLGTRQALVVSGADGLDEVTLATKTHVSRVTEGGVEEFTWQPEDFGILSSGLDELKVDGPKASAEMIRSVLAGQPGPARDIVVLNSAAAIIATGQQTEPKAAAASAATAIDSGAARELLARLVDASHTGGK